MESKFYTCLIVILDAHTECVDKYGDEYSSLKVVAVHQALDVIAKASDDSCKSTRNKSNDRLYML